MNGENMRNLKKMKNFMLFFVVIVSGSLGFVKISKAYAADKNVMKAAPVQTMSSPGKVAPATMSPQKEKEGLFSKLHIADIIATLFYSLMGLGVALFGYKVYDWITPFDLRKELEIDQNTSLGIVAGSIILGLCIIIAASIMSP
jgi:putative membrane protein